MVRDRADSYKFCNNRPINHPIGVRCEESLCHFPRRRKGQSPLQHVKQKWCCLQRGALVLARRQVSKQMPHVICTTYKRDGGGNGGRTTPRTVTGIATRPSPPPPLVASPRPVPPGRLPSVPPPRPETTHPRPCPHSCTPKRGARWHSIKSWPTVRREERGPRPPHHLQCRKRRVAYALETESTDTTLSTAAACLARMSSSARIVYRF